LTFFTGTGRHRVQITYFLWWQIGSWRPLGVGLGSGGRLRRMRRCLGPPRALEAIAKYFMVVGAALLRELAEICWKRRRVRCRRLTVYSTTLGDPRETSGAGIDRIKRAWPP
jgi:hypothetical protein